MNYNFDEIVDAIENGANVEEICKAFTDTINEAVSRRTEHKRRYEKAFDEACEACEGAWFDALCAYEAMGEWPSNSLYAPEDLSISKDTFKNLISALVENYELIELIEGAAHEINGQLINIPQDKKIVTNQPKSKSATPKEFDDVMESFFKKYHIN